MGVLCPLEQLIMRKRHSPFGGIIVRKSSLISVLIALVLIVACLMGVTATASAATEAGTFKIEGNTIARVNGYYYANAQFTYDKANSEAEYYWKAFANEADFKDKTAEVLFADENAQTDVPEVPTQATDTLYYVFAEKAGDAWSNTKVVLFDNVAPVIANEGMNAWLSDSNNASDNGGFHKEWISANPDFVLPTKWMQDTALLTEKTAVVVSTEEGGADSNSLVRLNIKFEFCPQSSYASNPEWASCDSDSDYSVTSVGQWHFRYVVEDLAGNSVTSEIFTRTVRDTTPPTIEFSTSQRNVETSGTPVGKGYSIPAPTVTDDVGSATYYFEIFRLESGSFVKIYNSDDSVIEEKYEDILSGSARSIVLTPLDSEVAAMGTTSPNYIYKVVYHATDTSGFIAEETLHINTTAKDVEPVDSFVVWKWVLIGISIASAIGIVVVIFIKPKKSK